MIRGARFSGSFYPDDREDLEQEAREFLRDKKENIAMAISPHAGWVFSGRLAGDVLGRFDNKKDFIMLGVNHSGIGGKIVISQKDFETPLGIIKNNRDLGTKILKKLKGEINEQAHEQEHSIEVQLPFLQESQKRFSIVPVLLRDLSFEECKNIAELLAEFIDINIGLVVSSDFTHYGKNYGFLPFTKDVKKNLYYLDNEIIVNILNHNSKNVYELASKSTVCGVYGITIASELAKIKKMKAKLAEYYTSGDVTGDFSSCVGYAGIAFR